MGYHERNLYELLPAALGRVRTVLCLGLLNHLPDRLRARHLRHALTTGQLFIETHCDSAAPSGIACARCCKAGTRAASAPKLRLS